ncbi:MAG TPA: class I SAM-dependent methyltransferase [Minicystis sp.]|nr:class I SAM-dependent methyltransferase [Minicystis sp.]
MSNHDWNERYAAGDLPWDTGEPDPLLLDYVAGVASRGRALEVGCGTGTNALWLARQGFDVLGVDLSPLAIDRARQKLGEAPLLCRFAVVDFLAAELGEAPFDFVFDRGCFHVFDEPEQRARFASRVAAALRTGGVWLSLAGSTEGPARDVGPPRRSLRDVAEAIEPALEIVRVESATFHAGTAARAAAWRCLSRRRATPAQPSTRLEQLAR